MFNATTHETPPLTSDLKDFVELLKPRVMSLVIFTSICGLMLAPGSLHPLLSCIAILSIAIGAGAAGCLNMWYEVDVDKRMQRTKNRPIPLEKIHPDTAFAFGIILSVGSVYLMAIAINYMAAFLLAFTIFFYVVVYTMILKPHTPQNIVIGGASGALPPVIGWVCVTGECSYAAFSLFWIIFFWTVPHFWSLALIKKEDYKNANIPMMPNTSGDASTKRQMLVYTFLMLASAVLPFYYGIAGTSYVVVSLILGAPFLILNCMLLFKESKKLAYTLFAYSIFYLFTLFLSMVIL